NSRDLYNQSLAIPRCRSEHSLATRPVINGGSSILCTLTELPPLVPGPRSHETSHFRRIIIEYERDRFEANVSARVRRPTGIMFKNIFRALTTGLLRLLIPALLSTGFCLGAPQQT